jgi:hypothetical protein
MEAAVYILGAVMSLVCTLLLFRGYTQSRQKLLFWSALCFAGLTVSNLLVFVDLVLLPKEMDLYRWRLGTAVAAMIPLLYGLIWESE